MSFRGQIWWSEALFAQMHGKGRAGRLGKCALLFLSGLVFVYACGRVGAVGSGSATDDATT